jgi:pimeloyl-ACP methyl ester carboxylesterase
VRRALGLLALGFALCGLVLVEGASAERAGWRRVHFRAADGILLDGRLFGRGSVGVVLSHMGRSGDTQADWLELAQLLDGRGYLVLTYDRRGICPGGALGCSRGIDAYPLAWKDVVGADDLLRRQGARRTVLIGASIGAMASLYAAKGHVRPAALVEFAGINNASGYSFSRSDIRRIPGSKLFLSSHRDIYGGAAAARQWFGWASPPKRLELVPGTEHGTDLLRADSPVRKRVEDLISRFVASAAPARG